MFSFFRLLQLFWPDDQLWYKAEVVSLNNRSRSAKVLYTTVRRSGGAT